MCYKICNFDVEAQTYIEAWKASKTKNELFEILDQSDIWSDRRKRLGDRYTMNLSTKVNPHLPWSVCPKSTWITNIEGRPSHYSTWQMAKYMHKALQGKGVRLPAWLSRDFHCADSALPLNRRLNKLLAA
jgi:hypothetical protein